MNWIKSDQELLEAIRWKPSSASILDNKKAINFLIGELGRTPFMHEFYPLCKKHNLLHTHSVDELYRLYNVNNWYSLLTKWGFEVSFFNPHDTLLNKIFSDIDPDVESELTFKIGSRLVRVDFKLTFKDTSIYIEVDGDSHYSINSKYHRDAENPAESFNLKRERDLLVESFMQDSGKLLVRFQYHHLISMKKEDIVAVFNSVIDKNKIISKYNFDESRSKVLLFLFEKEVSHPDIGLIYGVSASTISRWFSKYNLKNKKPLLSLNKMRHSLNSYLSIVRLKKKGLSSLEIKNTLGFANQQAVNYYLSIYDFNKSFKRYRSTRGAVWQAQKMI